MAAVEFTRRVDWNLVLPELSRPQLASGESSPSPFAKLTAELTSAPPAHDLEGLLRHAVEYARVGLELERAALFLLDAERGVMVGSFGTGARGEMTDERGLVYELGATDREVFERAAHGFPWTVYEGCPHVVQERGRTRQIGRGWLAGTAVRSPGEPIGILFNDCAISRATFDESKQSRAAIFCSLLGRALAPLRSLAVSAMSNAEAERREVAPVVAERLMRDPTLSCAALADCLALKPRVLSRLFKRETQRSIVAFRNEIRLTRFLSFVESDPGHIVDAAREAGFGSYAQFHRVFRARYGQSPQDYVTRRHQR